MSALMIGALLGGLLVADTTSSAAARPLVVETRGGLSVGAVESSGAGYEWTPGGAWRASVAYSPLGWMGVYVGYGRSRIRCGSGMCADRGVEFTAAGFDAGAQLEVGSVWARAGAVRHGLTAEWTAETTRHETAPPTVGLELATGVAIPLGSGLTLAPGMRWTAFSAQFPGDPAADRVRSLSADLGLRYRLR